MERTSVTPSATQLRALTHPVRLRMLGMLRVDGPATATTLAERLGLNTGATSYHLRQLAEHGFITDDVERGTGRERWWQAVHSSTHTGRPDPERPPTPEESDLNDAYLQTVATVYAEQMQRAVEEAPLLPQEWREASTLSDWQPRLTPSRAHELLERIVDLIAEFDDEAAPDAVTYSLHVLGFPRPGQLGPSE